jgi:predicted Zn-dependent peptidase
MNFKYFMSSAQYKLSSFALCFLLLIVSMPRVADAQIVPEPQREQLLNGLTVLLVPRPEDANVRMHLRVKSGAAFDLTGKEGTMSLLGDVLFPDPATREFITDELGGSLDVTTN